MPTLDAVFFVEECPEIELRNGMFHLAYSVGQCRFQVVLPPNAYFKALRRTAEVARGFHFAAAEIIEFPKGEVAAH